MRVTVATEEGETYAVDVAPEMELENVLALLEADVSGCSSAGSLDSPCCSLSTCRNLFPTLV